MTTRRTFMKAGAALMAMIALPFGRLWAETKKVAFALSKVDKLKEVGGSAVLKIKGRNILFVRDGEDSVRALNSVCSHKQCTVEYHSDIKKIVCPCHGSEYQLDGKVLSPPADKPLQVFPAELTDGKVILTLEE